MTDLYRTRFAPALWRVWKPRSLPSFAIWCLGDERKESGYNRHISNEGDFATRAFFCGETHGRSQGTEGDHDRKQNRFARRAHAQTHTRCVHGYGGRSGRGENHGEGFNRTRRHQPQDVLSALWHRGRRGRRVAEGRGGARRRSGRRFCARRPPGSRRT